jgi:hypothetical protein
MLALWQFGSHETCQHMTAVVQSVQTVTVSVLAQHSCPTQLHTPEEVDSKEEEGLQGLRTRGTAAKGLEAGTLGAQLACVPAGHL